MTASVTNSLPQLLEAILSGASSHTATGRFMVGVAGPPAAGKSTLAEQLVVELSPKLAPMRAALLPMDGYHLDDGLLEPAGLRPVKGAPATYDVNGFCSLLERVQHGESPVYVPRFDRDLELARNAAICIDESVSVVIVEGNYLLLDDPAWQPVGGLLDLTILIEVGAQELENRLLARWLHFGFSEAEARLRAEANDLPNGNLVLAHSRLADIRYRPDLS